MFNESQRISRTRRALETALDQDLIDQEVELIIVDDGSKDGTYELAKSMLGSMMPKVEVIRLPRNFGKGKAIAEGVNRASGSQIIFSDADWSVSPEAIPRVLNELMEFDVVIGSRSHPESSISESSALRTFLGKGYSTLHSKIGKSQFVDTQCGFKGFRRSIGVLAFHFQKSFGFGFDLEFLEVVRRLGGTVTEIPVTWREVRGSRVRAFHDSSEMLFDFFALSTRKFKEKVPGLVVEYSQPVRLENSGGDDLRFRNDHALPVRPIQLSENKVVTLMPGIWAERLESARTQLEMNPNVKSFETRFFSIQEVRDLICQT
jgi:dolichyl-phosphate beta-glucosyltransferase